MLALKIIAAALMVYMIYRIWPAVKHQMEHGKKGSSKEWLNFAVIMILLAAFVLFLIKMVQK